MCLFLRDKAQVYPICLLCLTFNCFLSFFSQSAILHSSTLCPLYECRRTGRPSPPSHTTPHQQHRYLPASRRPREAPRIVSVCRIYVSRRRCVSTYVCCSYGVVWGMESGGGLPVRRHSYGGHRVERWRASDWLKNDKKTFESQAE